LYSDFTKSTGIKINRVDADDAGILSRLKAEGAASPADVILLVDASRLWRAEIDGLFLPIKSKVLEAAIPENLRAKKSDNGGLDCRPARESLFSINPRSKPLMSITMRNWQIRS
jgi:iron(III) transport system substrate-binding protein